MKRLAKIARSATPSSGVQFRGAPYGPEGVRDFLRDVIAMANASVEGSRYIIIGAEFDSRGRKHMHDIARDDFSGKPSYQALANEFIEPPIRLRYSPVVVDGKRLGVYEIGDCQDRPYMMRVDHSVSLRRGDAYQRVNDKAVKMGRRQLQSLFEEKFRDSISGDHIEVGFPGDIIHKDHRVPVRDLSQLPSAIAGAKLRQLIEIKNGVSRRGGGSTTMVARLTHARLFGTDSPYEDRSSEELLRDMRQLEREYRDQDEHYLFEEHAEQLQLVVLNQGEEPIRDASVSIVMPNHAEFHVAPSLPKLPKDDKFVDRSPAELADYPSVTLSDNAVQVSSKLGDIPPGEFINVFDTPLRLCAGKALEGKRFGLQYSLFAQNLRAPAKGKLRLVF
ncbi:MAG: ATP-binding protein [Woeseiaceae bacterium]|nr:ATP-binding protein [Woeseiaceae bacterium]